MRVVDAKGTILDLPDEKAWAGLSSGEFGFEPGATVAVKNDRGTIGEVKAEDLNKAMSEGYSPVSQAELAAEKRRVEYETVPGAIAAVAAGTARGATLGLSDVALAGIGGKETQEALEAYRELFPYLSTGGEIAGAIAPAFLTGGSSSAASAAEIAATGAREASTLVRGASGLGRALVAPARLQQGFGTLAEHGVQALLGSAPEGASFLARGVRAVLPDMARGVAEGAVQGIGSSITDAALGSHDLTAESLIANIGHGAVMGGALGGAIGSLRFGLGEAKQGIASLLGRVATRGGDTGLSAEAKAVSRTVDETTVSGMGAQAEAKINLGDIHSVMTGTDPEVSSALRSMEKRRIGLREADKEADRLGMQAASAWNEGAEATRTVQDQVLRGAAKDAQMRRLVDEAKAPEAVQMAQNVIDSLKGLRDEAYMDPTRFPPNVAKKLDSVVSAYEQRFLREVSAPQGVAGNIFTSLDDLKYDIGRLATRAPGVAGRALQDQYNTVLRAALEDESIWGQAAKSQRTINAPYAKWIGLQREASRIVEYNTGLRESPTSFDELLQADPAAYKSTFKQIGGAESFANMQILRDTANAQRELAEAARKAYSLTAAQGKLVNKMVRSTEAYHGIVHEAEANMGLIRKFAEEEAKSAGPVAEAAKVIPGVGPVLSIALSQNPVTIARRSESIVQLSQRVKTLLGIEAVARATTNAARDTVDSIINAKPTPPAGRPTERISPVSAAVKLIGSTPQERRKNFEARRRELEIIASNPDRARVAAGHIAQDAPGVSAAVAAALQRQAQYMLAQIPAKPPVSPAQPNIKRPLSDGEILAWAQKVVAADDPRAVMKGIANGTAPAETVRAFRDLNPAMFAEMQKAITARVDALSAQGKELPYDARVRLSSLLGAPVDPSFDPAFVQVVQASYDAAKVAQNNAIAQLPRKLPAGAAGRLRTDRFTSAADDIERGLES